MDSRTPQPGASGDWPTDEMIALALGELTGSHRARVEAGLDERGRDAVGRLRQALGTLGSGGMEQAPASLLRRLEAMGRPDPVGGVIAGVGAALRRLIATLVFDSRVAPALAGFRGAADGRQLVFRSEAGDVHLRFTGPDEQDPRITLRGSIESQGDAPTGLFRLGDDGADARESPLDPDGMFVLKVPPGSYPATLRLGQVEIDLGVLDVA